MYAGQFYLIAYDLIAQQADRSRYHLYQQRVFDFGIKEGDKVLDMGSGHIPFPLATHLADISTTDHSIGRNSALFKFIENKPVFECSVEITPFEDKEFDFVYCSHVLEHVNSPENACRELMRIAKRGYIETPSKGKDIFMCSALPSNHVQYVSLVGNIRCFSKYQEWERRGIGYDILQQMHYNTQSDREKIFSILLYLFPRNINTMMLWDDSFEFAVF